jgi:hypothetical protein
MNQTRLESLLESVVNIFIGYGVALLSQILIFPMFDIYVSLSTNLWIGAWFTVISLIRSYVVRRWFNAGIHKAIISLAKNISVKVQ